MPVIEARNEGAFPVGKAAPAQKLEVELEFAAPGPLPPPLMPGKSALGEVRASRDQAP